MKIRNFADDSDLFDLVQNPKIAPQSQYSQYTGNPSIIDDDKRSIIQPPSPPTKPSSSSLLYWLVNGPTSSSVQWMQSLVAFRMLELILNATIKIITTIPTEYQLNCLEIVDSTRIIEKSSSSKSNVDSSINKCSIKNSIRSSSFRLQAQQSRKLLIRRPMNFIIVMLLVCLCTSFCGHSVAHPLGGDGSSTQPNSISKLINMNGYHHHDILARSEEIANQRPQDSNMMKLQMLNQLRINREQHRRAHHNSQSRLTDPIFDPNFEELSLDPNEPQADYGGASVMPMMMVEQYKTTHFGDKNQTKRQTLGHENADNSLDSSTKLFGTPANGLGELSLEDQNESVKEIIKSGWIQHSSTKKLLYYLRKLDEILFKDAEFDLDFDASPMSDSLKVDPNQESFATEDDDLTASKPKQQQQQQLQQQQPDELKRGGGEQNTSNKDWEIIMDRIMNTPNTMKKRGEGPQLSIDYPLTVLRQRLIAELARRKAKETEEQIAINTEILKKLGRRKRSVQTTNSIIDCDQIDCKLQDLNMKKSNVLQSLWKNDQLKRMTDVSGKFPMKKWNVSERNPIYKSYKNQQPSGKSKFRANDKYYTMDKWIAEQQQQQPEPEPEPEPKDTQTMVDKNNNPKLADDYYHQEMLNDDVGQPKLRFNSKKIVWPVSNQLNEKQISAVGPLFDADAEENADFWKKIKRANYR